MKNIWIHTLMVLNLALLISCDDRIYPNLESEDPVLVVDAFINDKNEEQRILVAMTQPYFDSTQIIGVTDAIVTVSYGDPATSVTFTHLENGIYTSPTGFGSVGDDFVLTITAHNESFVSTSTMNRVPPMDSVTFRYEEISGFGTEEIFYIGEFWAKDPEGAGDTYWIKAYKNGQFLGKPEEINIAYDAGIGGEGVDNLVFIVPVREGVNPYDESDDNDLGISSPYKDGDSLYVELHSITNETYEYLNEIQVQTNRPGGFGELFATPMSNVKSNLSPLDSDSETMVLGFFSVSSVSADGKKLDISQVPKED
ncbi:DUF4249 domain-containing protein [Reichenbachiella sp. 5M10]|uniref:DUF4249 domain-containing protein n=1 Tax=Reichenbachiella sp. 5M10 TaxID=1889772 RepID=UPI0013043427|nr:DUF4249 domain-containing protein [Reichenbachiella sp. 5M10]